MLLLSWAEGDSSAILPWSRCRFPGHGIGTARMQSSYGRALVPSLCSAPQLGPCASGAPFWTIFMALTDLVVPQAVVPSLRVNNKKQALHELASPAAAMCGRSEREVLEVLMQRERLGSTGIGSGIAIPHGKLTQLERLVGGVARLGRPD